MDELTNPGNFRYLEELYEAYRKDHDSVDRSWQKYFAELARDGIVGFDGDGVRNGGGEKPVAPLDSAPIIASTLQDQVNDMVRAYRTIGHRAARLDPLDLQRSFEPALDPAAYGFDADRMEQIFPSAGLHWSGPLKLREIVARLRETYLGPVGVEYMHIEDRETREWIEARIEADEARIDLTRTDREKILADLIYANMFDEFIRSQFVGAKSFSLEGAESLIALLQFAIKKSARDGIREIVMAMAHRGRLNVLVNVVGKKHRDVFREFIDAVDLSHDNGGGDVKYHLGYSGDHETATGERLHLSLCFNPSHLEFVAAVALGRVRAKQDRSGDTRRERGMALLIHGDAAFAGEGIIQETLNLSTLSAYRVAGALHVIVNNQIGFTSSPSETRAGRYASDTAKMLQSPIFHVNADEPEAVARVGAIALDYRGRFQRDVFIDLIGYRRHGHNEGDEPTFTQPKLYRAIHSRPPVHELYRRRLIADGAITEEQIHRIGDEYRALLERELDAARTENAAGMDQAYAGIWAGYTGGLESHEEAPTAVSEHRLTKLLAAQNELPANFHPHPKIARAIGLRREMAAGKRPLDWAAAESLAFASLASAGTRVRLTGQDTARGTFSQRHAVLHDIENGAQYVPLQHVALGQAPVEIYNSPLSEAGVLGYEYGYSLDYPDALVCWEAQFGDFVNAAQVIVDQFIASAEEKWRRLSGLVLLLPHGFEGMGPEHSSARMERFLQLAVRDNLQVVNPTTPAQYFHVLRRQGLRRWRKPLVVMTPKSLLRHREAVSSLSDFTHGSFQTVIGDSAAAPVKRILLCSGKLYYELKYYRSEHGLDDVAIIRVEQLYPTPLDALTQACERYSAGTPAIWVQEEPANMGAACFWSLQFGQSVSNRFPFSVIARPPSASPATGSAVRHRQQQAELLHAAFHQVP